MYPATTKYRRITTESVTPWLDRIGDESRTTRIIILYIEILRDVLGKKNAESTWKIHCVSPTTDAIYFVSVPTLYLTVLCTCARYKLRWPIEITLFPVIIIRFLFIFFFQSNPRGFSPSAAQRIYTPIQLCHDQRDNVRIAANSCART